MKSPALVLALTALMLPAHASAQSMAPDCAAPVGETVALAATPLSVEDVGGRYDTQTGWPAPGEKRVGALRYEWGLLLQTADPRFARVDAAFSAVRSAATGCWLGGNFVWGDNGVVTGLDKPRIVASPYSPGYVRPQPDFAAPALAGYRYVAASRSYNAAYPWLGLWAAEGEPSRTAIVAFNASAHVVLATLPYRLGAISTLPAPHGSWTGITVAGASLREPAPYLQLMWRSDSLGQTR